MNYYLMNAVPRRARKHREGAGFATIMALKNGTLPVFTSPESFWDFGEAFYPQTHELSPVPFEIGASDLADLADQMAKMNPVRFVVFDPVTICAERCGYATEPIPVAAYRRSIEASGLGPDR